jgi:hypothetical protein
VTLDSTCSSPFQGEDTGGVMLLSCRVCPEPVEGGAGKVPTGRGGNGNMLD